MRIQRVKHGSELYDKLIELDAKVFPNCFNEFKDNREWFVIVSKGEIISYSGSAISEGVCIFVRMWVSILHRGKGIQSLMIKRRIESAKKQKCTDVITYTTIDNIPSSNNLIKNGFRLYSPQFAWVGCKYLYWKLYD
jgi:hypothetical protein